MNGDLEDQFCEWVMLWNKDFIDDELHLQLEKESACFLQSVAIQSDQITGLSLDFLFSCLPKTNPLFFFTSGLVWFFFKEYRNTKCKNSFKYATVVWQIAYCPGSDSDLQKIYVLSLEICIIYRPPKSCTRSSEVMFVL